MVDSLINDDEFDDLEEEAGPDLARASRSKPADHPIGRPEISRRPW